MKVLVTGAAGLLGQYVCRRLLARGDHVFAVDSLSRFRMFGESRAQPRPDFAAIDCGFPMGARCDFFEASFYDPEILSFVAEGGAEAIVHCAAQTSHPRSIAIPLEDCEVNALGTLRLLEAIRKAPATRLVNISSCKIYDMKCNPDDLVQNDTRIEPRYYPFVNKDVLVGERRPLGGLITPFGVSKLAADLYVRNFSVLYDLDACSIRPGCFTGPQSLAVELQNWAPMLTRAMVRGETFSVFGYGGKQVRDLLHVDDLARLVLACIDHIPAWRGEAFNACGGVGRDISILEAVDLIERLTGKRGELHFEPARAADWAWFIGDNSKAESVLGWRPEIDIESIFKQLCAEVA